MAARGFGRLAQVASGFAALIGAAGCAEDGVSVHVICPIFPELQDDVCTYDATGEECLAEGVVNLASVTSYRLNLRVESGLTPRARQIPPQGEPNGMQIQSAEVEVRDASGARLKFKEDDAGAVPNPYRVVASGFIRPQEIGSVALSPLDFRHLNQLRSGTSMPKLAQIVVSIKLKGETAGGTEVESGEYTWPVRVIDLGATSCRSIAYCSDSFGQDLFAEACRQ